MKILSSILKLHTQYQDWLGAIPIKSSSSYVTNEAFTEQLLSAKDENEARAILEKHFDEMLENMPTDFDEDELIAEEDLPHWLRENKEKGFFKPLPELRIDNDVWLSDDKKTVQPLSIILVGVICFILIILGIYLFDEKIIFAFIPVMAVGFIAAQVINIRDRKSINKSWQDFAEQVGLDYEIHKDTRKLSGEYQGYTIIADTRKFSVSEATFRTNILLFDLRMSSDVYIRILPSNNFDIVRKLWGKQSKSAAGEFEEHFKIITEPMDLAYVISGSPELYRRLVKIGAKNTQIEIGEKMLFCELSTPPDKIENWKFLLNTLCILARQVERAEQ